MQEGDLVIVPDDDSGTVTFLHHGDPDDRVEVDSPHADSGARAADVAYVKYSDGEVKRWPRSQIKLAGGSR